MTLPTITIEPTVRELEDFAGLPRITGPLITWTDVVRGRMPEGAKAHRVELATRELEHYTADFADAWTVWVGPTYVGLLARGTAGRWRWSFVEADGHVEGAREFILTQAVADTSAIVDRNTTDSGK